MLHHGCMHLLFIEAMLHEFESRETNNLVQTVVILQTEMLL